MNWVIHLPIKKPMHVVMIKTKIFRQFILSQTAFYLLMKDGVS